MKFKVGIWLSGLLVLVIAISLWFGRAPSSTESSQAQTEAPAGTSKEARTLTPGRASSRKLAAREVQALRKLEEAFTLAEFDFQGFARLEGGSLSGEGFLRGLDLIQSAEVSDAKRLSLQLDYLLALRARFPAGVLSLVQKLPDKEGSIVVGAIGRQWPRLALDSIGELGDTTQRERFSRVLKEWLDESPFEVSIYAESVHDEAKKKLLAQELIVNLEAESQFEEAKKWRRYLKGVQEQSNPR